MAHIWTELFELLLQAGLKLTSDCWAEPTSAHSGMLGAGWAVRLSLGCCLPSAPLASPIFPNL